MKLGTENNTMRLFREVGLLSSTLLVIGNIIGTGIFVTSGLIAAEIGSSPWVLGVWLVGGLLALIGAVCYSVLSVHWPHAGGEYALLYPSYGPLPAFLSGWASLLVGFSAPIAVAALALAAYLSPLLPWSAPEQSLIRKGIAALVLLSISLLISLGLKFGHRLHSTVTILNLLFAVGFAGLVLLRAPVAENLEFIARSDPSSAGLLSLGTAIVMVMFSYSGWNAAAYIAEEIRRPERYIPGALLLGTVTVIIVYILMNLAYFGGVPLAQLQGKVVVAEITAVATFGSNGMIIVNVLILFSILSSITAMSIAGPRVYFAMSRNQLFPQWLADVDEERKIPLKSIWFQSTVALVLIASAGLRELVLFAGLILLFFATLTVSALFMHPVGEKNRPYSWLLYRGLPAVFVLINTVVLVSSAVSKPKEAMVGIVTIALGLPVYLYYSRDRASSGAPNG